MNKLFTKSVKHGASYSKEQEFDSADEQSFYPIRYPTGSGAHPMGTADFFMWCVKLSI
jgi:hypothetical protein